MEIGFLQDYGKFLETNGDISLFLLIIFGFFGGLLSSLLPCVLSLLPVNLAYIGTLKVESRLAALKNASLFVFGATIVLTCLGIFGSLAFAVFTEYKGLINLIVGMFIMLMSLVLIDVVKLPFPQIFKAVPQAGPLVIGMVFALVSSPCSSPVLISILSIASSTGSILKGALITFGYSLGYTAIIFTASLSTGLVKRLNWFKQNSDKVIKFSAITLFIVGLFYTIIGIQNL